MNFRLKLGLVLLGFILLPGSILGALLSATNGIPDMGQDYRSMRIDNQGRMYLSTLTEDESMILRVEQKSGVINYLYSSQVISSTEVSYNSRIFLDTLSGKIYAIHKTLDTNDAVISNKILAYLPDERGVVETILERPVSKGKPEYLNDVSANEKGVYFTVISENNTTVTLSQIPPLTGKVENLFSFTVPNAVGIFSTAYWNETLLVLTMDAKIYRVDLKGNHNLLFPAQGDQAQYFPTEMQVDQKGRLYFLETYSQSLFAMDIQTGKVEKRLDATTLIYPTAMKTMADVAHFSVVDNGNLAYVLKPDAAGNTAVVSVINNQLFVFGKLSYSHQMSLLRIAKNFVFSFMFLIATMGIFNFYRWVFRTKPHLLVKLSAVIFPIILIGIQLYAYRVSAVYEKALISERKSLVGNVGNFVAKNINPDLLSTIQKPQDIVSEQYSKLLNTISKYDQNTGTDSEENYSLPLNNLLIKVDEGRFFSAVSADGPCLMPLESIYSGESLNLFKQVYATKSSVVGTVVDYAGSWTASIVPLLAKNGQVVGLLETRITSRGLGNALLGMRYQWVLGAFVMAGLIAFAFYIAFKVSLRPLRLLKEAVVSVAHGKYGEQVDIITNDEFADISRAFNKLSTEVLRKFNELRILNKAYYRFVPRETFLLLHKRSILDIKLGDKIQTAAILLSSDLRDVHLLSKGVDSEQMFKRINVLFSVVSEKVTANKGIIHSYTMEKINVLYQTLSEHALLTANGVLSELVDKELEVIRKNLGFCIHKTSILYGIIGAENRQSPAVVAEHTDILAQLEALLRKFESSVLMTQQAYAEIPVGNPYHHRFIGYIQNGALGEKINIYEFFDCDPFPLYMAKKNNLDLFHEAMHAFLHQEFKKARHAFAHVLKWNSEDTVARWYLFRCEEILKMDEQEVQTCLLMY